MAPASRFETVTYMLDGIFEHQDSNGGSGVITNGDTQWMTAGAGILHIEKPPSTWLRAEGCSTGSSSGSAFQRRKWASALPGPPRAGGHPARVPRRRRARPRDRGRARRDRPWPDVHPDDDGPRDRVARRAARPPVGSGVQRPRLRPLGRGFSADRRPVATGQLAVFGAGDVVRLEACAAQESRTPALEVLVLGGRSSRSPGTSPS